MKQFVNTLPVQLGVIVIMIGAITLAALVLLIAALGALTVYLLKHRTDIRFGVIGVTNERRTVELLCALKAAHQAKADAALEKHYDERVAYNRHRRAERRSRIYLVDLDGRHDVPVSPFSIRQQAG